MDPTVEAAWIAGCSGLIGVVVGIAGTVTVAAIGFRSTRSATTETNATTKAVLESQIQASRDDRVYEKRAEAYVDALAYATWALHSTTSPGSAPATSTGPSMEYGPFG
jgi:hypothetical protein